MPTVRVRLDGRRDYPIVIETGALRKLGALARPRLRARTLGVVTHPRLYRLYGRAVEVSLTRAGFQTLTLLVPEGETSKRLAVAERLIGRLLAARLERNDALVALGGGVIGDLTGFVAATYMRGIDFIQVPTTLLAQVDSSVGGKVAVNHPLGKNTIGAFHQPRLVVADPAVLSTLPLRQFRSGLAEIIKTAAIADARLFRDLERLVRPDGLPETALSRIIARVCAIKARVVAADEVERGLRAILNYGHTLGHALEAYHGYRGYLHGEAIAIGMAVAARLAADLGIGTAADAERLRRLLVSAGLPVTGRGERVDRLMDLIKTDKKAQRGRRNFVLTPTIGRARICFNLPPFSVRRAVRSAIERE